MQNPRTPIRPVQSGRQRLGRVSPLAGPVAAMALQKAGIGATVHEAHPAPAGDVGAWLGVQVTGLDALRAIGAEQVVREVSFPTPVIGFRSGSGRRLGDLPTGSNGTVGVSVQRSELYRALHAEALHRGIEVRY